MASEASASGEESSFVSAIVKAPRARARSTYSTTSGVWPDCESATTHDPRRSVSAP
jgi:hypothetical protein